VQSSSSSSSGGSSIWSTARSSSSSSSSSTAVGEHSTAGVLWSTHRLGGCCTNTCMHLQLMG
jgi:hypothetical protein